MRNAAQKGSPMGAHKRALKSSEMERFETTEIPEVLHFPSVFAKNVRRQGPTKGYPNGPQKEEEMKPELCSKWDRKPIPS